MREEAPLMAPLFRLDPGWLFILAGAALLSSVAVIPVQDDLALAHQARDRALALEAHRSKRLAKYAAFGDALTRRDETLMKALAAGQLNLAPADREALISSSEVVTRSAGVFADLEPSFVENPPPQRPDSLLHALATNRVARLWVILIGAVAVLYGLLPGAPVRERQKRSAAATERDIQTVGAAA